MSFWTKEREAGVRNFKEKVGNSQVGEKEQTCGKQILLGHSETMGHRASNKQTGFFLSATLSLCYTKVLAPCLYAGFLI